VKAHAFLRIAAAAVLCISCGGSGGYGGGNTTPSPTSPSAPATPSVVTIAIDGIRGQLSFSPNPAMCATGQTVVWKNNDTVTHRVVIDELNIDTGDIPAGTTSKAMSLGDVSKGYHCALHPEMVGALNGASIPSPPPAEPCGPYGC
jgi:plastocyanin